MRRLFRLWRLSGRDLRVLFTVLRTPNRPSWLVPSLIALTVFALEPFNFAVPFLGIVDDLFVLPLLVRLVAKLALSASVSRFTPNSRNERVVSVQ
jgi:uncharacterized membrane protein YkvA (DUF1232 family)